MILVDISYVFRHLTISDELYDSRRNRASFAKTAKVCPGQPPSSVRTFQIRVPGRQCNDLRAVTEITGTGTGYLSEPLTKPSVTVRYRM